VLLSLFSITACSGNRIKVLNFSPTGEVQEFTTFQVDLSDDLAPAEKQNEWLDEAFLEFSPPVKGKTKWLSGSTFIFSPETPLAAGADYTAKITDAVRFGKEGKKVKQEEFSVHTPYFDAAEVDFYWTQIPHSNFKVTVQANLVFNYVVDPATLRDYLQVDKAGVVVTNYEVITKEPAKVIAINFGEQQQTEADQQFTIRVLKGLKSPVAERPMTETRTFDVSLAALTRLAITDVASGVDGEQGWIEVYTTQKVDEKVLARYLKLEPATDYEVVTTDNSFRLLGDFMPGSMVDLVIKKGLPGLYGGQLEEDYAQEVVLADLDPTLKFADSKGQYLMRGGNHNVEFMACNIPNVTVSVYEVFENNLLFYLYRQVSNSDPYCCGARSGSYYASDGEYGEEYYEGDYYEDEYYYDDYYGGSNVGNYGRLLHKDTVTLSGYKNRLQRIPVNLSNHLDQRFKGVYVVELRDEENYWRGDSRLISISDLGIIAKRSHDEMIVWVNAVSTAAAVADAEVSILSTNNQVLHTGRTDDQGRLVVTNLQEKLGDFNPRMVIVRKGDDFNFVDFGQTETELSRFDVGGKTEYNDQYDTYLFAERNLYRPGETANVAAIVRDHKLQPVKDLPVRFKVISPRGKTFYEASKKLDSQGSCEINMTVPVYAETGDYTVELYNGDKMMLGTYRVGVEEFVPDKIRVEVNPSAKTLKRGDELKIDIFGEYLFGAPCSDHAYEVDLHLSHQNFRSKKYNDYNFYAEGASRPYLDNQFLEESLDEEGKATYTYTMDESLESPGYIHATAYVTVFDNTGRTVSRSAGFDMYPQNWFTGIKATRYYAGLNEVNPIKLVAVDATDKDIPSFRGEVELIRWEWRTVLKKNYNDTYYYTSERKEVVVEKKDVTLSGGAYTYNCKLTTSGSYEVRFRKKDEDRFVSTSFYAYGSSSNTATSFQADREGRVEITTEKEQYKPGDKIKVLFTTPFSGKMLVTVERDNVIENQIIEVTGNAASIELTATDEYLPNVYVSATLFRAHSGERQTPFFVGHGFKSIKVDEPSYKLPVKINAPARIKPRGSQQITVNAGANEEVYMTLALVDEGILQIRDFETPDPYKYMYAKRKLSVSQYDLYQMLLPEVKSSGAPGGGDGESMADRQNPIQAQRFKLLSYWSGIRRTDASGNATFNIPIPQFNGEARVMAVAWTGKKFGSASQPMKISDDVVVMPAIPRFLAPGDSLALPVSVMNTTDKSGKVDVSIRVEGGLKIAGAKSQSVSLTPKGNGRALFGIVADNTSGVAKIIIETTGMDKVKDETEIAIRPTSPPTKEHGAGMLASGTTKVNIGSGFIPSTQKTTLVISKFPAAQFGQQLRELVGYPHGCLEQTTSKLFPQLYVEDLAAAVDAEVKQNGNPVYFVNEGIRKVQGMTMGDGSMSMWPGSSYSNDWANVYAIHFLVEAKKAGYDVNDKVLKSCQNYLQRQAANKGTYSYRTFANGVEKVEVKAHKQEIYALYVLALAGKADMGMMNYYRSRPHLLTGDTRYLLAGAFGHVNNWSAFSELLPGTFKAEVPERQDGGCYDSEFRANAIMLAVLADVDPNHKQVQPLINWLSEHADEAWSTQDRSWLFLAMGKAARATANSNLKVDVLVDGKSVGSFDGTHSASIRSAALNGKQVTLNASGTGKVYYFWSTQGVKASSTGTKEEDENLTVRRTFYTRGGVQITDNTFEQGDLVVVKISLTTGVRGVDNLAISDLIPAGFEIENPRLSSSTSLNWVKNDLYTQYMDIRDDRLNLYANMPGGTERTLHYMCRVVNAGHFRLAPIEAEAMYSPFYHSTKGAGWVTVRPKAKGGV
jgi:uncharacterized protein YfaS (alpha-2-macroglobulin family)